MASANARNATAKGALANICIRTFILTGLRANPIKPAVA
jgi:hypothetical protein